MLNALTLAAARQPIIEIEALEPLKHAINWIMAPEKSLPLFTIGFVLMLVGYRKWTKPAFIIPIAIIFCTVYFGLFLVDDNYRQILEKPDNVPITIMILSTGFLTWVAFREAAKNDTRLEQGLPLEGQDKDDKVLVWPDLVYSELICLVLAAAALIIWSLMLRAPLEAPANPAGPPNPSKAPWYFLGLQEMLVYFDPWMAGVILPGLIVVGLIAMPYIDTNPKGNGYYTLRERPFAIATWLFGYLILWVVLIVFGTFLRGPNWNFFGPTEFWDHHKQVPLTNVNLSDYFWNSKNLIGFGLSEDVTTMSPLKREIVGIVFVVAWIVGLPVLLAKTAMRRLRAEMGLPRFYLMAYLFVIMGLLPLKMVLRWLFVLKYFVNWPEGNLNF